jgi:hypothetical protein
VKLSEKESASVLRSWTPLLATGDQAKLTRAAALLGLADSVARESTNGHPLTVSTTLQGVVLEAPWLEPWPLQPALRRVQQVFAVNVALASQRA